MRWITKKIARWWYHRSEWQWSAFVGKSDKSRNGTSRKSNSKERRCGAFRHCDWFCIRFTDSSSLHLIGTQQRMSFFTIFEWVEIGERRFRFSRSKEGGASGGGRVARRQDSAGNSPFDEDIRDSWNRPLNFQSNLDVHDSHGPCCPASARTQLQWNVYGANHPVCTCRNAKRLWYNK